MIFSDYVALPTNKRERAAAGIFFAYNETNTAVYGKYAWGRDGEATTKRFADNG